jgi:hypothetical protein
LDVVAKVSIGCDVGGPGIATTKDGAWYVDLAGTNISGHPAHLRRVDPATNALDDGIDVPDGLGTLLASESDVFFADSAAGGTRIVYKLTAGADHVVSLGNLLGSVLYPAGDGIWAKDLLDPGVSVYTAAGVPDKTLSIEGTPVAGDESALYVERVGASYAQPSELWRYPVSGATPTRVAVAGLVQVDSSSTQLFYGDASTKLIVGLHRLEAIWSRSSNTAPGGVEVFAQKVDLP